MNIIWLDHALDDLEHIRDYYAENSSHETSEKIIQRIVQSVSFLSEHPFLGKPSERNKNLRELNVAKSNYTVPYRLKNNNIEILRVFDGRQKPLEKWI